MKPKTTGPQERMSDAAGQLALLSEQEAWLAANRRALEASNAFVEERGLPLRQYRQF